MFPEFIRVLACVKISFLFKNRWYCFVWHTTFCFPVSSSFWLLQTWEHKPLFKILLSGIRAMQPWTVFSGPFGSYVSIFVDPPYCFAESLCHFTFPPVKCRIKVIRHLCQHLLLPQIVVPLKNKTVPILVGVTSISLWFDLYFLNN